MKSLYYELMNDMKITLSFFQHRLKKILSSLFTELLILTSHEKLRGIWILGCLKVTYLKQKRYKLW